MEELSANPLIYADMAFIREAVADFVAQGGLTVGVAAGLAQVVDFVVATLETHALMARVAGKTFIFDGKLSVVDALKRASDLRGLLQGFGDNPRL